MIPLNPLQLHDLYRTSTDFHEQLSNFFRRSDHRGGFLNLLESGILAWLIEYLDSLSFEIVMLHGVLNPSVGSHWYFQPFMSHIPEIVARIRKDLR